MNCPYDRMPIDRISQAARSWGVAVRMHEKPSPAARAFAPVAEYEPHPPTIHIYRSEMRRVAQARGVSPAVVLREALAHELAHHTEPRALSRQAAEQRARRLAARFTLAHQPRTLTP